MIRFMRIARDFPAKSRSQVMVPFKTLTINAPADLREPLDQKQEEVPEAIEQRNG